MQKSLGGKILLENKEMGELSEKEISKRLSVVLTHPVKAPFMTVFDLVAFGRYPYLGGQAKLSKQDNEIIDQAIADVGIESLRDRYLTNLSDGERQKSALARSLAQQTFLILLDEPAAFLDFPSKIELMRLLKNLARNFSKSILLSTHDIEMAVALADHIWLIDQNRNIVTGNPNNLIENETIPKTFNIPASFFMNGKQRYEF
jgi:iron complex transport system ATP-binding protein